MSDAMPDLPAFNDLPVVPGAPPTSSWGLWGENDVFGCLNLLGPERVLRGAECIRHGRVFALNLDMELPDPPLFRRSKFRHLGPPELGRNDDVLTDWNTQSSSQWDGFRHVAHPEHGHYAGVAGEEHGVHHWARRGIVGRAVLVDVGRWRETIGDGIRMDAAEPITPNDILGALAAEKIEVEPGDILLLRTGWLSWYRGLDRAAREGLAAELAAPGLEPSEETCRLLWDLHISAIGADNPAVELWPPEQFIHTVLLPLLGLPLGELWDLDALAEDCAGDGVYESFFTSAPLNLRAGVASPPNALAIK